MNGRATSMGREPGAIGRTLIRLLMRETRVSRADALGAGFHLIGFDGAQLDGLAWTAGEKVQIRIGASALTTRTYTPIACDGAEPMEILVYAHDGGPGSEWARGLRPGEVCHIFGPRASLDLGALTGPVHLMGDETSVGLALAYRATHGRPPKCSFEVNDAVGSAAVLRALKLEPDRLMERKADGAHLAAMLDMIDLADQQTHFILTGKAGSIQYLRAELRARGVPASRMATKAYWAPGKRGLD